MPKSLSLFKGVLCIINEKYSSIYHILNVWEVSRPAYFPRAAGNTLMPSIALGRWHRVIERIELFQAPHRNCSGQLTDQILHYCLITKFNKKNTWFLFSLLYFKHFFFQMRCDIFKVIDREQDVTICKYWPINKFVFRPMSKISLIDR